jgi:hypothetical protein
MHTIDVERVETIVEKKKANSVAGDTPVASTVKHSLFEDILAAIKFYSTESVLKKTQTTVTKSLNTPLKITNIIEYSATPIGTKLYMGSFTRDMKPTPKIWSVLGESEACLSTPRYLSPHLTAQPKSWY